MVKPIDLITYMYFRHATFALKYVYVYSAFACLDFRIHAHVHTVIYILCTTMYVTLFFILDLSDISPERKQACIEIVTNLNSGNLVTDADLLMIAQLPDSHSPSAQFHSVLLEEVLKLKDNPVLSLLDRPDLDKKTFNQLFRAAEYRNNDKVNLIINHVACVLMLLLFLDYC